MERVGEEAARRLERRLGEFGGQLDARREELVQSFERRLGDAEHALSDRLRSFTSQAEAEHRLVHDRLEDLARRVEETITRTRERLAELESSIQRG